MSITVAVTETQTAVSTVENVAVLDTALEDVTVSTTTTSTSVGVAPYIIEGGTVGGSAIGFYTLSGATAVGDTQFTIDRATTPIIQGHDIYLVIDPYTVNCEIRQPDGITGTTVYLSTALDFAHSSSRSVFLVADDQFSAALWGAEGNNDNNTDDWAAIQAGIIQTQLNAAWLFGVGNKHVVRQPLFGGNGTRLRKITCKAHPSLFVGATTTNALFMSAQNNPMRFTADAVTDTITTLSGTTPIAHGATAGNKITFNAPNGQTLPTGITAGALYYVKTTPTSTTMTISTTNGGATLNITANGTGGWCYPVINGLERVFFEDVYFSGNSVTNLNGCSIMVQQPGYTNKLRVDGCAATNLIVGGQISNHYNLMIGAAVSGSVSMKVSGLGHNFFGVNVTGNAGTAEGVVIGAGLDTSAFDCNFYGLWTEQLSNHIRWASTGHGIGIYGWNPSVAGTQKAIQIDAAVNSANRSYIVTGGRFADATNIVLNDDTTGLSITAADLSQQTVVRIAQDPGAVTPAIEPRTTQSKTGTYTVKITDRMVLANPTGGAFTVTLPTAVGIQGFRMTIKNTRTSGANAVTVGTTSSQTIDGATTYSLSAQYQALMVESDGANWVII